MIWMALKFMRSMARHQWAKWCGYEVLATFGVQKWRTNKCDRCVYNEEGQCSKCKCLDPCEDDHGPRTVPDRGVESGLVSQEDMTNCRIFT